MHSFWLYAVRELSLLSRQEKAGYSQDRMIVNCTGNETLQKDYFRS